MQGKKKTDASESPFLNLEQVDASWLMAELDGTNKAPPRARKRTKVSKSALRNTPAGWRLRYASHKVDGRWIRPTILLGSFPDRVTAEAEALRFLDARQQNEPAPGTSPPWQEYSARYMRESVPRMRRESQSTTRSVITCHIDPQFADLQLHEVGARIQQWIDVMRDAKSPVPLSSMKHRVGVLKTMLTEAGSQGLAVFIPSRLKWPKAHRVRRPHGVLSFTACEQRTILATAVWPLKIALALGFFAGLRPSESVGLEWRLCDLKNRQLIISQQRGRHGEVALPKTQSSEACIDIVPELAEILERYYRDQRKQNFALAPVYLFPNRGGQPLSSATLRTRHLYPLLEGLGMPQRGLHACRRAFADRLLDSGAPVTIIQAALRHSNLQTTVRYLSKPQPLDVVAAIRKAAEFGSGLYEIAEKVR